MLVSQKRRDFYATNKRFRLSTRLSFYFTEVFLFLLSFSPLQSFAVKICVHCETGNVSLKTKTKMLSLLSHVRRYYFNCNIRASSVFSMPSLFLCNLMSDELHHLSNESKKGKCSYHEIYLLTVSNREHEILFATSFKIIHREN